MEFLRKSMPLAGSHEGLLPPHLAVVVGARVEGFLFTDRDFLEPTDQYSVIITYLFLSEYILE